MRYNASKADPKSSCAAQSLLEVAPQFCEEIANPAMKGKVYSPLTAAPWALMQSRTQPEITPDTPLRLADAVKIAFPLGGMTVAGLRRERHRNRLVIEKIAPSSKKQLAM